MGSSSGDDDDNYMATGQQVALLVAQTLSSLVSIASSLGILAIVLRSHKWKDGTYPRIMVGLAANGIIFSLTAIVGPYTQPYDEHLLASVGTTATCSASGFFVLFSVIGNTLYNLSLSIYFHETLVRNVTQAVMSKKYEIWFHSIPLVIGLTYGTVNAAMGNLNPWSALRICNIEPYPTGCAVNGDTSKCDRGQNSAKVSIFLPLLVVLCPLLCLIFTIRVYRSVRRTFQASSLHLQRTLFQQRGSLETTLSLRSLSSVEKKEALTPAASLRSLDPEREERFQMVRTKRASLRSLDPQREERFQMVRTQSILYCSFFLGLSAFLFSIVIVEELLNIPRSRFGEPGWFTLILFQTIAINLNGFYYFSIYIRPSFISWRKQGATFRQALISVLQGKTPPRGRGRPSASLDPHGTNMLPNSKHNSTGERATQEAKEAASEAAIPDRVVDTPRGGGEPSASSDPHGTNMLPNSKHNSTGERETPDEKEATSEAAISDRIEDTPRGGGGGPSASSDPHGTNMLQNSKHNSTGERETPEEKEASSDAAISDRIVDTIDEEMDIS